MKTFLDAVRSNMVAQAVLSIVLGLLLAFLPGVTAIAVVYMLAVYLAVSGAASLVAYLRSAGPRYRSPLVLANAVVLLVLALLVFMFPQVVAGFFSLILGVFAALSAAWSTPFDRLSCARTKAGVWVVAMLVSVAVAIGGIVIIANPFATTAMFVLVLGVLLVAKGRPPIWLSSASLPACPRSCSHSAQGRAPHSRRGRASAARSCAGVSAFRLFGLRSCAKILTQFLSNFAQAIARGVWYGQGAGDCRRALGRR